MSQKVLERSHIVYSELTDTAYIATGKEVGSAHKKGDQIFIASTKVARDSDFMHALMQWCGVGNERDILAPDGKVITVSMTEKTAEDGGK